jgi:hypothetical protein
MIVRWSIGVGLVLFGLGALALMALDELLTAPRARHAGTLSHQASLTSRDPAPAALEDGVFASCAGRRRLLTVAS